MLNGSFMSVSELRRETTRTGSKSFSTKIQVQSRTSPVAETTTARSMFMMCRSLWSTITKLVALTSCSAVRHCFGRSGREKVVEPQALNNESYLHSAMYNPGLRCYGLGPCNLKKTGEQIEELHCTMYG